MDLRPINPYYVIQKLTEEVERLEEENEELKKQIPTNDEDEDNE